MAGSIPAVESSDRTAQRRWAFPLDVFPEGQDPLGLRAAGRWIAVFLVLGVAARLVRYGLCFPLWQDEAFLAASFIDRGYGDMLRPLEYHQVCPLLFLWAQLTAVKLLGFCEYSLRLFPLLCSLASLAVFWHMAGRLLRGTALVLAVGIFSIGYPGIRYAAETKPYGCDLLVSLAMLALLVQWWRRPERSLWLWALIGAVPLAIGFSYPAVFTAGGISLGIAWVLWTDRARQDHAATMLRPRFDHASTTLRPRFAWCPVPGAWTAWLVYNLAVAGSFAAMYALCIRAQDAELTYMRNYWSGMRPFPPLASVGEFLRWLVTTHTGEMLAHPVGGPGPASILTFIFCATALVVLCRRRQLVLPLVCAMTLALNFVAAALHRFPYAGHVAHGALSCAAGLPAGGAGPGRAAGRLGPPSPECGPRAGRAGAAGARAGGVDGA